jgi:hypothetical protein
MLALFLALGCMKNVLRVLLATINVFLFLYSYIIQVYLLYLLLYTVCEV